MLIAGVAFLVGCIWQVAAKKYVGLLLVGRIFWGVGVGFADQSVTIYNAEMAPPQWRGLLHTLFQTATVTGKILVHMTGLLPSIPESCIQQEVQTLMYIRAMESPIIVLSRLHANNEAACSSALCNSHRLDLQVQSDPNRPSGRPLF